MSHLAVVIPVYKAEECLLELYHRLKDALELITSDFEIVMVEDCGGDRSWKIIQELAQKDFRVKGFQFSRNFGQHYSITAGLDQCNADWVVVMDCDLQDLPEEIPKLYAKAQEGYDVVLAKREVRRDNLFKTMLSKLFYKMFNYLSDIDYDHRVGNFRIMSRVVVLNYRSMREQLRFLGGLVNWMGFLTTSVDVQHGERFAGKSTYTFRKLCKLAGDAIIAYSDKPLRISIKLGFLMSFFAFMYGLYVLLKAFMYGSVVMGWSSLIISIYFIGGMIIAILGIIGIYLGKTFDEVKKRPLYIVKESTIDDHSF